MKVYNIYYHFSQRQNSFIIIKNISTDVLILSDSVLYNTYGYIGYEPVDQETGVYGTSRNHMDEFNPSSNVHRSQGRDNVSVDEEAEVERLRRYKLALNEICINIGNEDYRCASTLFCLSYGM